MYNIFLEIRTQISDASKTVSNLSSELSNTANDVRNFSIFSYVKCIVTIKKVFKWLLKVITWLQCKILHQFSNQWRAKQKPIKLCTCAIQFSCTFSKSLVIVRSSDWCCLYLWWLVRVVKYYFGVGFQQSFWKPLCFLHYFKSLISKYCFVG